MSAVSDLLMDNHLLRQHLKSVAEAYQTVFDMLNTQSVEDVQAVLHMHAYWNRKCVKYLDDGDVKHLEGIPDEYLNKEYEIECLTPKR